MHKDTVPVSITDIIPTDDNWSQYSALHDSFLEELSYKNQIQGMGFGTFAILAGVCEMAARGLAGMLLVPRFGFMVAIVEPMASYGQQKNIPTLLAAVTEATAAAPSVLTADCRITLPIANAGGYLPLCLAVYFYYFSGDSGNLSV